jgi:hypothetical protein
MKAIKYLVLRTVLIFLLLNCVACIEKTKNRVDSMKNDTTSIQQNNEIQDPSLASIYSLAIKQFIETVKKKDNIQFDTLYFGKHVYGQADDFPDITLPKQIVNTQILLIDPDKANHIWSQNINSIYINLMGFVEKNNAKFIFITFTNGFKHQYDYTFDFNFNANENKFDLNKIEFEDYRNFEGKKPSSQLIFSNGKYQ